MVVLNCTVITTAKMVKHEALRDSLRDSLVALHFNKMIYLELYYNLLGFSILSIIFDLANQMVPNICR